MGHRPPLGLSASQWRPAGGHGGKDAMSYDKKCHWLAEQFLEDTNLDPKEHAPKLAQEIQDAIEKYLEEEGG